MDAMNKLVVEMIEKHQGGEKFFDDLDANLKNEKFIEHLWKMAYHDHMIGEFIPISSGKFGLYFSSFLSSMWHGIFNISVNGGLRNGEKIISLEPWEKEIRGKEFIFFDDSFYLGRTRNIIKAEIEKWGGKLIATYVCYDGSKDKDNSVNSIYRYYDKHI